MCANGVNNKFCRGIKYFRGVQIFQEKVDRGSTFLGGPNISLQDHHYISVYDGPRYSNRCMTSKFTDEPLGPFRRRLAGTILN